jgi:hypothetical protein
MIHSYIHRHFAHQIFSLVFDFQFWISSYFAILALSLLAVSVLIGWLYRSHKPALVTYIVIMIPLCADIVCDVFHLAWRYY